MSFGYGQDSIFASGGGPNTLQHDVSFADPFRDLATTHMPTSMRSVLFWSEAIWTVMGTYRMAMERIVSYFINDVELSGKLSDDEREKYLDFLLNRLNILAELSLAMRDRMCYGNSFVSLLVPFRRFLRCPETGDVYPLHEIHKEKIFNFEFTSGFDFVATCPKTGWRGPWIVEDKPREESEHLIFKRWSPHEIEILCDPYTNEVSYLWRIPDYYKQMVREGNLFHLERTSKQVLLAIKHNRLFRFNKEAIYHMKEPTLAGIVNMGWGIPRSLTNFRQLWYIQVLRRYNEAIAMDYLIPFRLITPATTNTKEGITDPMSMMNGGDFRAQVRSLITRRRKDPAGWHSLPFPVNYQMLGGDAKQLVPTDLIEQSYDILLNETGTPVEFYRGSMQTNAHQSPMALRLFESTHWALVSEANRLLQWVCDRISDVMSWERVKGSMRRVTLADDMQKQMAALQLMMSQSISGRTGLQAVGLDWDLEQRRLTEEARKQQELAARAKEEMDQAGFAAEVAKGMDPVTGQMAGQPPQGGDPSQGGAAMQGGAPPSGPGAPSAMGAGNLPVTEYIQSLGPDVAVTPNEMQAVAQQIANDLLGKPEGVKDSELRKLKQAHPTLHAVVRSMMDDMRRQARMSGQQV